MSQFATQTKFDTQSGESEKERCYIPPKAAEQESCEQQEQC